MISNNLSSSSSKHNDFPESIDLEFLALNRTFKIRFYKSNSHKSSNSNVYKIGNNDDLTIHVPKNHQVIFNWKPIFIYSFEFISIGLSNL